LSEGRSITVGKPSLNVILFSLRIDSVLLRRTTEGGNVFEWKRSMIRFSTFPLVIAG
jgi:hypothetical protein